jgi:hypothetical protein
MHEPREARLQRTAFLGVIFVMLFFACFIEGCEHSRAGSGRLQAQTAGPQPASAPAEPQTKTNIRNSDLNAYVKAHVGDLNPDLADLQTSCGEGQQPVSSIAPPEFGDLDGDGQEEAAIVGFSCLSGTGGPDFFGVLKLLPDGKIDVLPIDEPPKVFKGRNPLEGLRGHLQLRIKDGHLLEVFPVYNNGEPNCCAEGGERQFVYRWNGHKFVLDDVVDVPPEKSGT